MSEVCELRCVKRLSCFEEICPSSAAQPDDLLPIFDQERVGAGLALMHVVKENLGRKSSPQTSPPPPSPQESSGDSRNHSDELPSVEARSEEVSNFAAQSAQTETALASEQVQEDQKIYGEKKAAVAGRQGGRKKALRGRNRKNFTQLQTPF